MIGTVAFKKARISFYLENIDNTEEYAITNADLEDGDFVLEANKKYDLICHHCEPEAGSATTYAPALGEVTGFATGDIEERMAYKSQAYTDTLQTQFPGGIQVKTDANGQLYYQPRVNAGADNDINVIIELQLVHNNA